MSVNSARGLLCVEVWCLSTYKLDPTGHSLLWFPSADPGDWAHLENKGGGRKRSEIFIDLYRRNFLRNLAWKWICFRVNRAWEKNFHCHGHVIEVARGKFHHTHRSWMWGMRGMWPAWIFYHLTARERAAIILLFYVLINPSRWEKWKKNARGWMFPRLLMYSGKLWFLYEIRVNVWVLNIQQINFEVFMLFFKFIHSYFVGKKGKFFNHTFKR